MGDPLDGWEGERWLDVRNGGVLAVHADRLALAATKGCDGVEPDNVTASYNDTGFDISFDISPSDQLTFNRSLADLAHQSGLTIGLKNDLEQIPDLVAWFDFAVNEQCRQYDECEVYSVFIDAGKPVFNAEYADEFVADPRLVCGPAHALGLSSLILGEELDDSRRISC